MTKRDVPFSWLSPLPLWRSRNDRLARWFGDPTDDRRRAWVEQLGGDAADRVVRGAEGAEDVSFLVMGDTGEGDVSQYAVVPPLLSQAGGTAFLFVCSDVIYPAGGVDEYMERFFRPYRGYEAPIYAVPGNHDWYDDATGFMYWFCGQRSAPKRARQPPLTGAWLRDLLWRRAPKASERVVAEARDLRSHPSQQARQPGPYFAIDAGPLRLVGIDTGITGGIDHDQAAWLRHVSRASGRPKVLLTGKPIYVDAEHHPGPIEGEKGTVDDIVTDPAHNYIAAIGGDIHNYQRYPVRLRDGRTILYLVSGGGGAFMHETHTIPSLDTVEQVPVGERDFHCYPLRGDSLSRYSHLYARKLFHLLWPLRIDPDVAAAIVGRRLHVQPARPSAQQADVGLRARLAAGILFALPGRGRRGLHVPFSEWLDWNRPPMFKSFLRVDTTAETVTIRCFAATGCASQEADPPVEDELHATRQPDGAWRWAMPDGQAQ